MSAALPATRLPDDQRQILHRAVAEAYMEIFPTPTIESKLDVLEPNS